MPNPSPDVPVTIFDEMARQAEDARRSFAANGEVALRLAESTRRSGRLLLIGMGGSHAVNRVAEPGYRAAGIDATAITASEALNTPVPAKGATVLLTSQSGESGEIVAYLKREADGESRFGMTLNAEGTLARTVPSIVAHGGPELAFAASRSLYVSLVLHARVLHELGLPHAEAIERATQCEPLPVDAAVGKLEGVSAVIFSGRGAMQGVAETMALGMLELARLPAFALEGGQLRHGPVEALGPGLAVVFIRQVATAADSTADLAAICVEGNSPTLLFDASGESAVAGATTVAFPKRSGIEAALTMLPTLQQFLIGMAQRRVKDLGQPVRSTKVTRET